MSVGAWIPILLVFAGSIYFACKKAKNN
ncbi:not available [Bacillus cereus]|nr:not available [Bacillus cereus]